MGKFIIGFICGSIACYWFIGKGIDMIDADNGCIQSCIRDYNSSHIPAPSSHKKNAPPMKSDKGYDL